MDHYFEIARKNMVDGQLRPNKVTHPVLLDSLSRLPRERFVPALAKKTCYSDGPVLLGDGRFMIDVTTLARLVQAANIQKTDVVLDIGCATGYSSALLASLASTVIGLEKATSQAVEAQTLLRELGILNAVIIDTKKMEDGYPQQAPYDVIFINGAVTSISEKLKEQLADRGRLISVLQDGSAQGTGVVLTKNATEYRLNRLFDTNTPLLCEKVLRPSFTF